MLASITTFPPRTPSLRASVTTRLFHLFRVVPRALLKPTPSLARKSLRTTAATWPSPRPTFFLITTSTNSVLASTGYSITSSPSATAHALLPILEFQAPISTANAQALLQALRNRRQIASAADWYR